jgi:hypothetical protein
MRFAGTGASDNCKSHLLVPDSGTVHDQVAGARTCDIVDTEFGA